MYTSLRALLLLGSWIVVYGMRHPDGFTYKTCLPSQTVCRYWLVIQEKLTMVFHGDLVYAEKGKLYLYNESPSNWTTEVRNFSHPIHPHGGQILRCLKHRGLRL